MIKERRWTNTCRMFFSEIPAPLWLSRVRECFEAVSFSFYFADSFLRFIYSRSSLHFALAKQRPRGRRVFLLWRKEIGRRGNEIRLAEENRVRWPRTASYCSSLSGHIADSANSRAHSAQFCRGEKKFNYSGFRGSSEISRSLAILKLLTALTDSRAG